MLRLRAFVQNIIYCMRYITFGYAAHAAIRKLNNISMMSFDKLTLKLNITKLIKEDTDMFFGEFFKKPINKCSLPGSQKSGNQKCWYRKINHTNNTTLP